MAFNNKAPDVKSSSKFLGIQVLLAPHQGQGGGLNISRTGQSNYKSILKAKPSKHTTTNFCVGSPNCAMFDDCRKHMTKVMPSSTSDVEI